MSYFSANHPSRCPQELPYCEDDDVLIGEDGGSRTASSRRAISALNRTWWAVGAGHDRDYLMSVHRNIWPNKATHDSVHTNKRPVLQKPLFRRLLQEVF